jgi:hypothetical protein
MSIFARVAGLGLLSVSFLAGTSMISTSSGPAAAPQAEAEFLEHHPRIHEALHALREARVELKEAKHDYGGHRDEAIRAIDASIHQLEVCLKY